MSTIATTARLQAAPGSHYAEHNGQILPISYHFTHGVFLALPHSPAYTVHVAFTLDEVELIGERPDYLQPGVVATFPAEFETEQSCWEGSHTSYVWQKNAGHERIVGTTPAFYKVATIDAHGKPVTRRVAKTKLRFAVPVAELPVVDETPAPVAAAEPAGPYVVTLHHHTGAPTERRHPNLTAALDDISECGALILMEDREAAPAYLATGYPVPYTVRGGIRATLHLVHLVPLQRRALLDPRPGAADVTAPGVEGEPITRGELCHYAGFIDAEPTAEPNGGWVTIYGAAAQRIDAGGAEYAVVCEVHGNIGAAATMGRARALMGQPALFCVDCANPVLPGPEVEFTPVASGTDGTKEVTLYRGSDGSHKTETVLLPAAPGAAEHDVTGLAAASLSAGLEPWQRSALIDMADTPGTPADVLVLLMQCTDEQLVLAAGFAPMLPALLQSELPAAGPLFSVGNAGPSQQLPPYRPGCVLTVQFDKASEALARTFYQALPKSILATWHPLHNNSPGCPTVVQAWVNNATPGAAARGARFYRAMQALSELPAN